MSRPIGICLFTLIALVFAAQPSSAGNIPTKRLHNYNINSAPQPTVLPQEIRDLYPSPSLSQAVVDTFILAWFDFDEGSLGSAQGWTSIDRTAQIDTFFHVADASELDGGQFGNLVPLQGAQSLWCGLAPSSEVPYCGYATLPGYGNSWDQIFESRVFSVVGDVTLAYQIFWDSESGYDETRVQYQDPFASHPWYQWKDLPVNGGTGFYDATGNLTESLVIASSLLEDSLRLRFRFTSDVIWSDEDGLWPTDGAVLIDSLVIMDATGTVDYQDFEGEAPGDAATLDGSWRTVMPTPFGDFADLYSGTLVYQEDPCIRNLSFFWGFFDDPALSPYLCHVPDPLPHVGSTRRGPNEDGYYLDNQIWSPLIPFDGSGNEVQLRFDVYRDLPLDNLTFFIWYVRSWVGGCPGIWKNDTFVHYGGQRDWHEANFSIGSYIDPGATHIQIAIGAFDACPWWCGIFGCGNCCRSQGPLVDNVIVERIDTHGPRMVVRHIDLFQDNFAEDGTLTGYARADCANDIDPYDNLTINPGDSISITATDPSGLATDAFTGTGPAVYAYIGLRPRNQAGKSGLDLEAPETGTGGKRYPLVDSLAHGGITWYCFRMDSALGEAGVPEKDRYCFDLNDAVFTPGDTICYVLGAENTGGERNYWSRDYDGQGDDFLTGDLAEALDSPCEFTILPAGGWQRGGNILYVDDGDDRGGPLQLFFDSVFLHMGLFGVIDRYDVLGPSSVVNNSLASRVTDVTNQIIGPYKNIIWSSGNLTRGLVGDGTGNPEKSDDFGLLFTYLHEHPNNPGLYLSGDNIAEEWANYLWGSGATSMRSLYMNFDLDDDDHVSAGERVSPTLVSVSPIFTHDGIPDTIIAFGGCPEINDFDLLQATGMSLPAFDNPNTGRAYMLSQTTPNTAGSTARVILSGFNYSEIHQHHPRFPFARMEMMRDILIFFHNIIPQVVGIDESPRFTNRLDTNYPNPFNPTTTIRYSIAIQGQVTLKIYNVAGQLVRTLINEKQSPREGGFTVRWDGLSETGSTVASGVYFYRLQASNYSQTRKMVLLK